MVKLAIDAMGGDHAPREIVQGVNLSIKKHHDLEIVLFGDKEEIAKYLIEDPRITVVDAKGAISMGEKDPVGEIRKNKESSLVKAFQATHDKLCDGVVTAGPTQATIVAAHLIVKRIKGMQRVAICPALPFINGKSRLLLDVGANVELKPEHLLQLAQYASIYLQEMKKIDKPLVGLLNIGTEPGKGREVDKETFVLLENDKNINFYGNVEPKEIFETECDILITDGFTGNMVMKTCEGVAKSIGKLLKENINTKVRYRFAYLFMRKVFRTFKKTLNPDEVGGANIFGVDGVIVKAHGSSDSYAFSKAIDQAYDTVNAGVIAKMKKLIGEKDETQD